jgi:WhiB family redox-sensing transcriptional regulator
MSRKIALKDAIVKYKVSERSIHRRVVQFNVAKYISVTGDIMYNDDELSRAFKPKTKINDSEIKISYNDVDWERANCRGIGTDLFYLEEDLLRHKGLEFSQVRGVCFVCPIREQCLQWAYATKEEFGMFGGVSAVERRYIAKEDFFNPFLSALRRDLENWGISLKELAASSKARRVA